jgi:hypothetical protein
MLEVTTVAPYYVSMMDSINEGLRTTLSRTVFVAALAATFAAAPAMAQGAKTSTTQTTTSKTSSSTGKTAAKTSTSAAAKGGSGLNEPTAPPTGKNIEVWELKQTSKMVGPINCLISPQAVRLRAEKMGITWMFKAPKWDAYLFNTETRNYCSFPYAEWKDKVFFMPSQKTSKAKSEISQMKVEKTGKTITIAGAKAYEVALVRPTGTRYGELWMATDIVAPKQFSEVVGSMVMVPIKTGGAPLRASMFQQRVGKIMPAFDTTSAVKKSVDTCVFEPMKGFNKVKDEMALLFAESPDGSGGMFESQGGKSPLR